MNTDLKSDQKNSQKIEVQVRRNKIVESFHRVNAVVMSADGQVLHSYFTRAAGEDFLVFPRSAIKFAQALCFVKSGAIQKYNLDQRHVAISCASHWAQNFHTNLVQEWLLKMGQSVQTLECGAHYPADEETAHQMIRQGESPSSLHNNCSGKHAGMIAACLALGFDPKGYTQYTHPVQNKIREILTEISGFDFQAAAWGVDGCNIPTYPIRLDVMAKMLTALLPQRKNHSYVSESAQIAAAIQKYPELISGTNGFCTKVIQATSGRVLAKTGAEGVYVALNLDLGQVIALKVQDGQTRASKAALLQLMQQHNWLNEQEFMMLKPIATPDLMNWTGQLVGDTKVLQINLNDAK